MKKKALYLLPLFLIPGICLVSCKNGNNVVDPSSIIKKLAIATNPTKVEFAVGDKFSSDGLTVNLLEVSNDKIISTTPYNDYSLTYNGGMEINNETILAEGNYEIMIISDDAAIRSTSYEIKVRITEHLDPLIDVVNKMHDTNNYMVENLVGSDNNVKGLMTENALIWTASEEAYFMDEGWGYGSYNDRTFRYKIEKNQIKDACYITDLGPKARDYGLFSDRTVDDMADRRISNYNMKCITYDDIQYLTNLQATPDNPNLYMIEAQHSKWLFNAIGHTQLSYNPVAFLADAKIYLEVKEYGLDVNVVVDNTSGAKGCQAKITNIGKTTIPGMEEFLKKPSFGEASSNLTKFQDILAKNNYKITYEDDREVYFTDDYIYGSSLDKKNNFIKVKANNKLNKAEGNYNFHFDKSNIILDEKVEETSYLTKFPLLTNLENYFKVESQGSKRYIYTLNPIKEQSSNLTELLTTFTNYKTEKINNVVLEFNIVNQEIFQVKMEINTSNSRVDTLYISSFGETQHPGLDKFITNLY